MGSRRPPDILRKSHAHTEGKQRAQERQRLREAVDESLTEANDERALLIDLDGVIYRGNEPIAGAAETMRWLQDERIPHLFVTNTTSRPRTALVEKLAALGMDVAVDSILAPPEAAVQWLAGRGCRRVLLAVPSATAGAFEAFDCVGLDALLGQRTAAEMAVDAVVVGDLGAEWNFERLNAAFRCLMQKPAPHLVALGMTRYWRAPDGLRLDTAPFVVALAHASGVEPTVLGKPAAAFFAAALEWLGLPAGRTWMIGDDIRADVAGAQAAGLSGILVRTGKFAEKDLESDVEPDLVIDSIAMLPEVWPELASS